MSSPHFPSSVEAKATSARSGPQVRKGNMAGPLRGCPEGLSRGARPLAEDPSPQPPVSCPDCCWWRSHPGPGGHGQ